MNSDITFLIIHSILAATNGVMYVSTGKWISMFACGFCSSAAVYFIIKLVG